MGKKSCSNRFYQLWIREQVKIGLEILAWAANNNHLDFIYYVLTKCEKSGLLTEDLLRFDGDRLLTMAVWANHIARVELLLAQYEKIGLLEAGLRSDYNLLVIAVKEKSIEMVDYLLTQYEQIEKLEEGLDLCGVFPFRSER